MNTHQKELHIPQKFTDPELTINGEARASVSLTGVKTLWFNTGTLCNIECVNCYIESSPKNDRLVYMTRLDVEAYLKQIEDRAWPVEEIAFTGGEPFMNPEMIEMADLALSHGYRILILTNAMRPMMRKSVQKGLIDLHARFADKIFIRVSLDHHTKAKHDEIRGKGSFDITLKGLDWLRDNRFQISVAGRTLWEEGDAQSRAGYRALYEARGYQIDAQDPTQTVLFPEMDETVEVPEITTACWDILGKRPADIMCASSRMVVKRKGALRPSVVACTLLPYDERFDLGETLEKAETDVKLNHPHCAKFCVLGGASCSA